MPPLDFCPADKVKNLATSASIQEILKTVCIDCVNLKMEVSVAPRPTSRAATTKLRIGSTQTFASFDLSLKNEGDAPVSTFRITLQLPPLPAGQTIRLHVEIGPPSGHAPFKIPFTVDAIELQAVGRLGSLAVIPPKS